MMIVRAFLATLNLVSCIRRLTLQSGVVYFALEVTLPDGAGAKFGEMHSAGCYSNKSEEQEAERNVCLCLYANVCLCLCA